MKKVIKELIPLLSIGLITISGVIGTKISANSLDEQVIAHPYGQSNIEIDYVDCGDEIEESSSSKEYSSYDYSNLEFNVKSGGCSDVNNKYTSTDPNTLVACDNVPFEYGTFEVTIKGTTNSTDDGIIFGVYDNGRSSYWEDKNVYYYFFFLGHDGYVALGKVANKTWTSVWDQSYASYNQTTEYKLKLIIRGSLLIFYVNDAMVKYCTLDQNFRGNKFGLRAGGSGVSFSNISVSSELVY